MTALRWTLAGMLALTAPAALAHQLATAVIQAHPADARADPALWQVRIEAPTGRGSGNARLGLDPGPDCALTQTAGFRLQQRWVRDSTYRCERPWSGRQLRVLGLNPQTPDALLKVTLPAGGEQFHSVNMRQPQLRLAAAALPPTVREYFRHGAAHIAGGWDHLLFVVLLFWSCRGTRLLWALTGFTLAHACSLAGVLLGGWRLPAMPVETLIALSLVVLAAELQRAKRGANPSLTLRHPALIAVGFGLLHGLGFAGALLKLGLPDDARWLALALFNLGIEAGQLVLVAGLWLAARGLERTPLHGPILRLQSTAQLAIGGIALFWALQRLDLGVFA